MQAILTLILILAASVAAGGPWERLPSLPDKQGFAGTYAGTSGGALLVAGGANFPDKKPWEGGKKTWYDTVYVLGGPDAQWRVAGRLPRSLGYGVSVTHRGGVVCAGGSDADRHYPDAFRLEWKEGRLVTTPLPPLPQPIANACGALVGDRLYVAGGLKSPDAAETLKSVYEIDLSAAEPKWRSIEPCPGGGRMLAVAAALDGAFWLIGGADLVSGPGGKTERRYLKDVHRYDPGKGWKRVADLPHPVVAAPTPAPAADGGFYVLGGDDASQLGVAPELHKGFSRTLLRYDLATGRWKQSGNVAAARVTTSCVRWGDRWIIPTGETHPGVRSPEVWSWRPQTQQ